MNKPELYTQVIDLGDGKKITLETGRLAKHADGSVVVRMGKALLLATVVSAREPRTDLNFFPLTVDYLEKFSAVGRFPGGFLKRESRPSDGEVLTSRMVDRTLRPLFPEDYKNETQVMISLMSADKEVPPDALAGLAASTALTLSDIPFNGPISKVRVARINGEFKVNPYFEELAKADIEMMVAGSMDSVNMVEGEMHEVSEDVMLEAIKTGHEAIKIQCQAQLDLLKATGRDATPREYTKAEQDEALQKECFEYFTPKVKEIISKHLPKAERRTALKELRDGYIENLPEEDQENDTKVGFIKQYFSQCESETIRRMVLDESIRLDGRKTDEVRDIWSEVDYLPSAHGSAIFSRGETQALATLTMGSKSDEQMIDNVMEKGFSKFMLHYNFPPFSTGETKPLRGPGRREVGHGKLALKGLKAVLPSIEDNPYTIRIVSDVLESNGSSSMATVCASSMALMDAGIKVKKAVSGIAMGLIMDENGKYAVLSDILGDEDHLGDMDFKITGTRDGITACQMDIKAEGLTYDIMAKALNQAKEGRMKIMDEMNKTISEHRENYKDHAPRIERFSVNKDSIGTIIGPGGRQIQSIQEQTGTNINIDEVDGRGMVEVSNLDGTGDVDKAVKWIQNLIQTPEVGETYKGKVKAIMPFGAFVEFMPGKDGLLHISEISWERIPAMDGVLEVGEEIEVKLIELDEKTGKSKLSRKALIPKPEKKE